MGCHCDNRTERRAGELLRAFMDAGDNLDARRAALAEIKAWRLADDTIHLEKREERRLIAASKADKVLRMRGLTKGKIGAHLALCLMRRMLEPHVYGGPESIEVLARRHRIPLMMVKRLRDGFIRRTTRPATATTTPAADTRRLLQLGTALLSVAR
jgi:hypothetical protein